MLVCVVACTPGAGDANVDIATVTLTATAAPVDGADRASPSSRASTATASAAAKADTQEPEYEIASARATPQSTATSSVPPAVLMQAKQLFAEGVHAFQAGEAKKARLLFEQAYAIAPLPQVLFNMGQAARSEGNLTLACETFQRYVDEAHPDAARIAELKKDCPHLH